VAIDPNGGLYPPPGAPPDGDEWEQAIPGRSFAVAALTFAAIATVIPVLPAIVGIVFASRSKRRGDPLGQPALVLNLIAMGIGVVVAVIASDLADETAALIHWVRP
jgi:hypothetical protein